MSRMLAPVVASHVGAQVDFKEGQIEVDKTCRPGWDALALTRVIRRLIIETPNIILDGPGDDDLGGMPDIAGFDLGPRK